MEKVKRLLYANTMVCGVWCVVYGVWCMVCDVWCVVYGVWCMVYGVWCVVYRVWCVVYGGRSAALKHFFKLYITSEVFAPEFKDKLGRNV